MSEQQGKFEPREIRIDKPETGGSFTVEYDPRDLVANSVGHVLAIPTFHLPFLTMKDAFKTPSQELAHQVFDRWKDVPWKGDVLVRIGHTSLLGDFMRTFANDKDIKGRPNVFVRALEYPFTTLRGYLEGKLYRQNFYNPFTNTVTVFHPNIAVGMHEVGHAQFFDRTKYKTLWALAGHFPGVSSFMEWKASAFAMKQLKNDTERLQALKILEPAWATYLVGDTFKVLQPFLPVWFFGYLGVLLRGPITSVIEQVLTYSYAFIGAVSAGHLLSRLPYPGKRERFGWVFEGKKPVVQETSPEAPLENTQVRYAYAKSLPR